MEHSGIQLQKYQGDRKEQKNKESTEVKLGMGNGDGREKEWKRVEIKLVFLVRHCT